jgi:acetylornithine/succinyldiaminopimelate/putrescine aminotransferase
MGDLLKSGLLELQEEFPSTIREVRGFGLMIGVELDRPGEPVVAAMRERKILINCTDQTVLRFLPPLIVNEEHIEKTTNVLRDALQHVT